MVLVILLFFISFIEEGVVIWKNKVKENVLELVFLMLFFLLNVYIGNRYLFISCYLNKCL